MNAAARPVLRNEDILRHLRERRPPCLDTLRGELLEVDQEAGRVVMAFEAVPEFCHSGDIVQGGFITGMLDTAMANAAMARGGLAMSVPTLELKVSFFAPGHPGPLRAEAEVVRWGRSTAFLEATLFDGKAQMIARASSTVRLVPARTPAI